MEDQEVLSKLFKALSHPVRLAILATLRDEEQCVCHMEAIMGLRQAYISQQLMILREAGLVQDRREGWNIFYRVVEPRIYTIIDAAAQISGSQPSTGYAGITMKKNQLSCDCPKCKLESPVLTIQG